MELVTAAGRYSVLSIKYSVLSCAAIWLVFLFGAPAHADPVPGNNTATTDAVATRAAARSEPQRPSLVISVTIFVLAIFLGVELIAKVPTTLHTPLMSGSNAISGITVVGALIAAGMTGRLGPPIAFVAVVLAMINVVGGFLVTHRMLQMFQRK